MSDFLYGVELPTFGGSGGAVSRHDLAHAPTEIPAASTHTIPVGEQYIVMGSLLISGSLVVDGTLVVL